MWTERQTDRQREILTDRDRECETERERGGGDETDRQTTQYRRAKNQNHQNKNLKPCFKY